MASLGNDPRRLGMPPGWECVRTWDGRLYYVDHNTHTVHDASAHISWPMLPRGWDQMWTWDGRLFYVDHNTHMSYEAIPEQPTPPLAPPRPQAPTQPSEGKRVGEGRIFPYLPVDVEMALFRFLSCLQMR